MTELKALLATQPRWDLDGLVRETNRLLPSHLPGGSGNAKLREEVSPRLVRHYATLGLLSEPLKEGREARYTPRHLLQLLVIRRLMAEGFSASALGDIACRKDDGELLAILAGGAELAANRPAAPNAALDYLAEVSRGRQDRVLGVAPDPVARLFEPEGGQGTGAPSRWRRVQVRPGLELHARDDFRPPRTTAELDELVAELRAAVEGLRRK
ncbi:MAG: MerR family transcriptional regulator [Meiothermus sp.]|nr:MerR family transcriptional regulator [Meiothermus sp.]